MERLPLTVDSRVRMPLDGVPLDVRSEILRAFTYENPEYAKVEAMRRTRPWIKLPPKAVATWKRGDGEMSIPRGGMGKLREILRAADVTYQTIDAREHGEPVELRRSDAVNLFDFQERIGEVGLLKEQGIFRSPPGSGKTTAAIALISRVGVRTLVVVPSKALLDQWVRRLTGELAISTADIGILGGGKRKNTDASIVVGLQQTLYRVADDVLAPFGCVVLDEAHHAAARTFVDVIDRMPARYRFGFSADERRKDRKEFRTYDVFGDVLVEVSRKELEDRTVIHDVELRVVPTAFRAPWYEALGGPERADPDNYRRLLGEIVTDPARRKLAVDLACREAAAGETVLVFSIRVEHCRGIRADVAATEPRVGLLVGAESAGVEDDFEATRTGLASGAVRVGVGTYQSLGEGVDLPSVSRGICATPIHTNRQFFGQVRGRVCRIDRSAGAAKTDAKLFYLWDRAIHGLSALRSLIGWTRRSLVLVDGQWVDARKFLKAEEARDGAQEQDRSGWVPGGE